MTPADFDAFSAVVTGFAELRGKQLSAEAITLYFRAMESWPLDDFKAAAEQLLRTSQFMSTPYDFEQLRKAGRAVPAEAWIQARAVARTWRPNMSAPKSGDELIDRAVESIGGYRAIAMCNLDVMGFLERRFIDAYETIQDAEETREAVPQLAYGDDASAPRRLNGPVGARDALLALAPPKFGKSS